jgi:hypothetical protein
MMRPNLRLLGPIPVFVLAAGLASAAPPSSPPPGSSSESPSVGPPRVEEFQSLGLDRRLSAFSGVVLDVNDRPISGVQVKLFMDGQITGSGVTDGNGYYDLRAAYDPSADMTVFLWFVAPERSLMPKELVLQESRASIANGLISRCVPRATLTPGRQFRVYLFDPSSRNKELAELNCLP